MFDNTSTVSSFDGASVLPQANTSASFGLKNLSVEPVETKVVGRERKCEGGYAEKAKEESDAVGRVLN
ncbi:hypothetical protein LTR49_028808, partial [Elasticomyces elasticus]